MKLALLLCALLAGAALTEALPAQQLTNRRALQEKKAEIKLQMLRFRNKCKDTGVDFRTHFEFDGEYEWLSEPLTDIVPRPFVDYFCDQIGEVNFQFGDDTNRSKDPEVLAKIAEGQCLNEQVLLRPPGYQGRGPQPTLELEVPKGTVRNVWVAVNSEGEEPEVAPKSPEEEAWRTADFAAECTEGEEGCTRWYKMKGLTADFECAKN